ncbi:MAG: hypothetical protein FJY97_07145 [candidate division Zixibacteria bacterium]|nr:hypothetical protein [candidate division Zixibacteria bacterium]
MEHADAWEASGVNEVFDLIGDARIRHGSAFLTSDRVRYDRLRGEIFLRGRVHMTRDKTTLAADSVVYRENDRRAIGMGVVHIEDPKEGTHLSGTKAEYFHRPRHAVLTGFPRLERRHQEDDIVITGNRMDYFFAGPDSAAKALVDGAVTVMDRSESVTVICASVEYRRGSEKAFMTGTPRMEKRFTGGEAPVIVSGKRMIYGFSDKRADVYDSVRILQGALEGVCDTVVYSNDPQQVLMRGKPAIRDAHSEIRGEEVLLILKDDAVSRAVISGRATGVYASGDTVGAVKSSIRGHQLMVDFEDDAVRSITAIKNASSEYHPSKDRDAGPPGHNLVSASKITILLDRGKLVRVSAEEQVDGSYRTPRTTSQTQAER